MPASRLGADEALARTRAARIVGWRSLRAGIHRWVRRSDLVGHLVSSADFERAIAGALRELLIVRELREDIQRRKARRLCQISRDRGEVREVRRLYEEMKIREKRAWAEARRLVAQIDREFVDDSS